MIYNKNNLKITQFCGTDERPVLSSVAFYHDRTVATDSYCLIEVKTPDLRIDEVPIIPNHETLKYIESEPIIVDKKAVDKVLKSYPAKSTLPILDNVWFGKGTNAENAEFLMTDLETATPIITKRLDSKYPDYKQIIPQGKPIATIHINPVILKKACDYLSNAGLKVCDIGIYADDKPIVITAETEEKQKVRILVMPLKV